MRAHVHVVHDLGLNGGSISQSQVGPLIINSLFQKSIESWTTVCLCPFPCWHVLFDSQLPCSSLKGVQVLLLFEHVSPLSDFRPKKRKRKTKEEDLATLRTKTRPWVVVIRVLHLIFSLLQAVKQLFCTVASPSKEIKVAQLRSKQFHWVRNKILDRKWFHWNSCSWYCCRDLVPCELKVDCDKDT